MAANEFKHKSILLDESVKWLITNKDGVYVDCTMGGAGHSFGFASQLNEDGMLIGIDQDEDAIAASKKRLAPCKCRIATIKSNLKDFDAVLDSLNIEQIDGIFFDLGVSSYQLDTPERGFSYMHDGPLDMRMDKSAKLSAEYIVNNYSESELADIIHRYGEERWSKRIAAFIAAERKNKHISTTFELVEIIKKAIPKGARMDGPHPAKRTFQAIRIELNRELDVLRESLDGMIDLLDDGGRICIITFHSLEDRIVKTIFRKNENPCTCPPDFPVCVCGKESKGKVITRKPILPSKVEMEENPRSKSAKLRIFERRYKK